MSEPVFVFENADDESVPALAEMVSHETFDLSAKTLPELDNLGLFGDGGHSCALHLAKDVIAHVGQKAFGPPRARYGHVNILALEAIEDDACDYLAISFNAENLKGRAKASVDFLRDEPGYPLVGNRSK